MLQNRPCIQDLLRNAENHFNVLLLKNVLWQCILYKELEPICFHYDVKIALNK